jgi:hypothetical protein
MLPFRLPEALMPKLLSNTQLHQLARQGAVNRIAELRAEIAKIEQAFPKTNSHVASIRRSRTPGHRGWSPAQRKAAALRMKKYWATRKAGARTKR